MHVVTLILPSYSTLIDMLLNAKPTRPSMQGEAMTAFCPKVHGVSRVGQAKCPVACTSCGLHFSRSTANTSERSMTQRCIVPAEKKGSTSRETGPDSVEIGIRTTLALECGHLKPGPTTARGAPRGDIDHESNSNLYSNRSQKRPGAYRV